MKVTPLAGITLGIALLIPYMSDNVLNLLDHPIFRIGIIVALLLAIQNSIFAGLCVLLLFGVALLQRNSRKLKGTVYVGSGTPAAVLRVTEDADMPLSPSIRMVQANAPSGDELRFEPEEDSGSDEFSPVAGASIDRKFVPVA